MIHIVIHYDAISAGLSVMSLVTCWIQMDWRPLGWGGHEDPSVAFQVIGLVWLTRGPRGPLPSLDRGQLSAQGHFYRPKGLQRTIPESWHKVLCLERTSGGVVTFICDYVWLVSIGSPYELSIVLKVTSLQGSSVMKCFLWVILMKNVWVELRVLLLLEALETIDPLLGPPKWKKGHGTSLVSSGCFAVWPCTCVTGSRFHCNKHIYMYQGGL